MTATFKGTPDGWNTSVIGAKIQGYLEGRLEWSEALAEAADEWAASRR